MYDFCTQEGNCTEGADPWGGLVQSTNGGFYGTTFEGGNVYGCGGLCGTVFALDVGLAPFVEPQTTSGSIGAAVKVLGTDLTGATSVNFNGTPAKFKVFSGSLILTAVPAGATTGKIDVTTPSGTLISNVDFRVLP